VYDVCLNHCYLCYRACYRAPADDTEKLCQTLDLQQLQELVEAAGAEGLDAAARAALLKVHSSDMQLLLAAGCLIAACHLRRITSG
jgi:H2-forming N5,N10-methylenetetrahydromethanopterin dehydrogenase-like enzyme